MRLTKDQSRERWAEVRELWRRWDPIGVFAIDAEWPKDEYDAYLGPSLRLLESGSSSDALVDFLADVELNRMGLSDTAEAKNSRAQFAAGLQEWFNGRWLDHRSNVDEGS
jgi:hypothetical protein